MARKRDNRFPQISLEAKHSPAKSFIRCRKEQLVTTALHCEVDA